MSGRPLRSAAQADAPAQVAGAAQRFRRRDASRQRDAGRALRCKDRHHAVQQLVVPRVRRAIVVRGQVAADRAQQTQAAGLVLQIRLLIGQLRDLEQVVQDDFDQAVHAIAVRAVQDAGQQQDDFAPFGPIQTFLFFLAGQQQLRLLGRAQSVNRLGRQVLLERQVPEADVAAAADHDAAVQFLGPQECGGGFGGSGSPANRSAIASAAQRLRHLGLAAFGMVLHGQGQVAQQGHGPLGRAAGRAAAGGTATAR